MKQPGNHFMESKRVFVFFFVAKKRSQVKPSQAKIPDLSFFGGKIPLEGPPDMGVNPKMVENPPTGPLGEILLKMIFALGV